MVDWCSYVYFIVWVWVSGGGSGYGRISYSQPRLPFQNTSMANVKTLH